jgi:hypothetical protein
VELQPFSARDNGLHQGRAATRVAQTVAVGLSKINIPKRSQLALENQWLRFLAFGFRRLTWRRARK